MGYSCIGNLTITNSALFFTSVIKSIMQMTRRNLNLYFTGPVQNAASIQNVRQGSVLPDRLCRYLSSLDKYYSLSIKNYPRNVSTVSDCIQIAANANDTTTSICFRSPGRASGFKITCSFTGPQNPFRPILIAPPFPPPTYIRTTLSTPFSKCFRSFRAFFWFTSFTSVVSSPGLASAPQCPQHYNSGRNWKHRSDGRFRRPILPILPGHTATAATIDRWQKSKRCIKPKRNLKGKQRALCKHAKHAETFIPSKPFLWEAYGWQGCRPRLALRQQEQ